MRNTFFLVLACLYTVVVFGQDFEAIRLQQKLMQHPQKDTTRVNLLNTLATGNNVPPDEQEKLAIEASAISRKMKYSKGEGYALLNLGNAKLRKGDKQGAVLLVQQADSFAKVTGDQELLVSVLLRKAIINSRGSDNRQALVYAKEAEAIALKTGNKKLLANCQNQIAGMYGTSFNDYPKAIEYALKSVSTAEEVDCLSCLAVSWSNLGAFYNSVGDQNNALMYYKKGADANKQLGNKSREATLNNNIGERYRVMGKYQEAIPFYNKAIAQTEDSYLIETVESNLADVYTHLDKLELAFKYAFSSLSVAKQIEDIEGVAWIDAIISRIYLKKGMVDSALYYAKEGLAMAQQTGTLEYIRDNAGALSSAYAFNKDFANAYNYHLLYINYRDSMLNSEISNKSALLQYNYDLAKKEAQITTLDEQRKVQRNYLTSALIIMVFIMIIAVMLLRNNRLKQKANHLLEKQKLELQDQRDQTNKALAELQRAQRQLIQSEKMASLGELTAGIAHEIQNPLNFVNNFSETNTELLDELVQEAKAGNAVAVLNVAAAIKGNEQKIAHHGRRADAIVKGMLEHSRNSKGEKKPTNINAFTNEYLKIAYHGFRTKDKSFNTIIETHFEDNIGKVSIVPQEIGRVLLNLYNNAFYAVGEKKKQLNGSFVPRVDVLTKKQPGEVILSVRDNGGGIPQKNIDKIFQPFFTTKPTGEGTGLGLSLSYDIIKAHGGELKVQTREGEGSEFIIELPA